MMRVGGQTGGSPPIGGLYLEYRVTHTHTHTHTHTLTPHGDWDWFIDCIETNISQRTAEVAL